MATIIRSYEANTRMMKQNSEMLQEILRQVKLLAAHLGIMDEGEIRGDGKGIVSLPLVVLADIILKYENQYQHVAEAKYDYLVFIIDSITGGFEAGISKDMRQIATVGGIKSYEKKLPTSAKVPWVSSEVDA
ncbi:hypothetical protein V6N12_057642 [Hibiscus sabdariffa]|uniref:Uncharacterized protein n=1 Tax=Hibiscus sabdariffa TaxID=183260 RepID=A0ABR2C5Q5_9ROSI